MADRVRLVQGRGKRRRERVSPPGERVLESRAELGPRVAAGCGCDGAQNDVPPEIALSARWHVGIVGALFIRQICPVRKPLVETAQNIEQTDPRVHRGCFSICAT